MGPDPDLPARTADENFRWKTSRGGEIQRGDRVVGSMKRVAQMHVWRSKIHPGAMEMPVELGDRASYVAVRASKAVGPEISGVDPIFCGGEPSVLKVNESAESHGLQEATNVNPANSPLEYAVPKAST